MTVDPLPRPAGAHLMTTWGDAAGQQRRRCSCGREDGATFACLQYGALRRLLDQAAHLIRAGGPRHAHSSWMPAACGAPAARRQRGLAYLALIAAGGQQAATGPAIERDTPGASEPATPAFQPDSLGRAARLDPVTDPDTTTRTVEQMPPGKARYRWVCGHSAIGPTRHGWTQHRHPCPECHRYPLDRRCPGVAWTGLRTEPLAAVQPRPCGLCGAPAVLYPCGLRCDTHAPWALAGRPDPRRPIPPPTYRPLLEAV